MGDDTFNQGSRCVGKSRPDRLATARISTLLHGHELRRIIEQRVDRIRDRFGRSRFDQRADAIGQQFASMNIRRGNHGLAQRHRIAQRARGRLLQIGIGRQVDVASLELVEQFGHVEKAIFPDDVVGYAEFLGLGDQLIAIGFALAGHQVGVRCADDAVDHVRMLGDHCRQRRDYGFQPLAGVEQPECHQHLAARQSRRCPERLAPAEGSVGRAVVDHHDAFAIQVIQPLQQLSRVLRHDHDPPRTLDEAFEDRALAG